MCSASLIPTRLNGIDAKSNSTRFGVYARNADIRDYSPAAQSGKARKHSCSIIRNPEVPAGLPPRHRAAQLVRFFARYAVK
jgi:hypothetical protein